jgi:hypothetical protein
MKIHLRSIIVARDRSEHISCETRAKGSYERLAARGRMEYVLGREAGVRGMEPDIIFMASAMDLDEC